MKKTLLLLALISFSSGITAQVKVNQNAANSAINTSSAFMDASSSPLWSGTTNQGKGMLYPRVDLVNYTAMSHAGPFNASNNPNYFDGLLVFNTATGIAGIGADSVFPGYYYYRNTTTTANGGHWVSLKGINGATGSVGPIGLTGAAGTNGLNALIKTTTEPAGANCTNGGTKIETGLDANSNGTLDAGEVNASQTRYVCNGNSTPQTINNNQVSISIGDYYQGGLVGYILKPADIGYDTNQVHGLIVAPFDQGSGKWGCTGVSIICSDNLGSGMSNTVLILSSGCSEFPSAASLCANLVLGGYSDWFLPSKQEFIRVTSDTWSMSQFNWPARTCGNYTYWTSSTTSSSSGTALEPGCTTASIFIRGSFKSVRAMRYF